MDRRIVTGLMVLVALSLTLRAPAADLTASLKKGKPALRSAGPLAFGPDGVLFVADPMGASLVAIATGLTGLYLLYAGPGAGVVPTGTAGIGLGVLVVSVATSFIVRIASMLAGSSVASTITWVAPIAMPAAASNAVR